VASAVIGWILAGRVLRPLSTITATARRISASSLHERLALHGPDDELRELADTLDSLFARLEASFDAQQRFAANASHELRTLLTRRRPRRRRHFSSPATWSPHRSRHPARASCPEVASTAQRQAQLVVGLPVDRGLACVGPVQAGEHTHRGGLAGTGTHAVPPDQRKA
jgi:signal transduction histidine kinase